MVGHTDNGFLRGLLHRNLHCVTLRGVLDGSGEEVGEELVQAILIPVPGHRLRRIQDKPVLACARLLLGNYGL